eukprot:Phypoly_transcript_03463.p1 GENE.Phypoly_transcript_03463~~Phypoly_transcript_03463.p1  ORF type:complete len:594 (+),score=82.69 Phypoly_transcript_03463:58-1782(+)
MGTAPSHEAPHQANKPAVKKPSPKELFAQIEEILKTDDVGGFQTFYDHLPENRVDQRDFFEITDTQSNNVLHVALANKATHIIPVIIDLAKKKGQLRTVLTHKNFSSVGDVTPYELLLAPINPVKGSKIDPLVALTFNSFFDKRIKCQVAFAIAVVKEDNIEWLKAIYQNMPEEIGEECVPYIRSEEMFRVLFSHYRSSSAYKSMLLCSLANALSANNHEFLRWVVEIAKLNLNEPVNSINNSTLLHDIFMTAKSSDNIPTSVLEILFKNGAKVDTFNAFGFTPVHEMVLYGNAAIVQFTLDYFPKFEVNIKAPKKPKNNYAETLLDCVVLCTGDFKGTNREDMFDMLLKRGAKINATSPCVALACNPIFSASHGLKFAKKLLENGADPNVRAVPPEAELFSSRHPRVSPYKLTYDGFAMAYDSALGALCATYDFYSKPNFDISKLPSKTEIDENIETLLQHKASLSPQEVFYHLSIGDVSSRLFPLAESQSHAGKIPVRVKQNRRWMFEEAVFSCIVRHLDARSFSCISITNSNEKMKKKTEVERNRKQNNKKCMQKNRGKDNGIRRKFEQYF